VNGNANPPHPHPSSSAEVAAEITRDPLNLEEKLVSARIEWPHNDNKFFVPADALERLISVTSILEEIRRSGVAFDNEAIEQHTANETFNKAPRLFAILVYLRLSHTIREFLNCEIDDADLPLVRYQEVAGPGKYKLCSNRKPGEPIKCMEGWDRSHIEDFFIKQWCMQAPFFKESRKGQDVNHYEIDDNCVLPFIKDEELNEVTSEHQEGGFGSVWEIIIHRAHHNLHTSTSPGVSFHLNGPRSPTTKC
jgi:hypothetical protein